MWMTRLCAAFFSALLVGSLGAGPLDVMLVLEASQGTEHIYGLIRPKMFEQDDRAGVIAFNQGSAVLQPLTSDRGKINEGLRHASSRINAAVGPGNGIPYNINMSTNLSTALGQAFAEFDHDPSAGRERIVVAWFGSEDHSLSRNMEALRAAAHRAHARLYAIAVQRANSLPRPYGSPRLEASYPYPTFTTQVLSQLIEDVGGQVFKTNWDLKEILKDAR
jgi:hypothetical protein